MNRFIVVDFETTGGLPRQGDKIIQIGAVTVDNGQIGESFSTLVNPEQSIPPFITQLTGIHDDMVENAPTMEEVLPDLLRLLEGRTFVAHNALFDLQFLQEALLSQGYYTFDGYVLDTVEMARILLPMQSSYRLGELTGDLEIEHDRPHQADSDAMATAQLLLHLLDTLRELPLITLQQLQVLVSSYRSDFQVLLREVEMEKLTALSFTDDGAVLPQDTQWDIFQQVALRKPPRLPKRERKPEPVGPISLERLLEEEQILSQTVSEYRRRDAQEEMLHEVYAAMNEGAHLLVEAGTGIGKTLAYLLPAVVWAKTNKQQVVISTRTIQLQEQIYEKEIPALQQALPFSFTAAKLKGRSNYLCLRKFAQSLQEPLDGTSQELRLIKAQILVWLTQTITGDVEELSLSQTGQQFWQQINSTAESCQNHNCPWFSRCFYFRAKEQVKDADIVIVNHALLVSDLKAEGHILPPYQVAIIDEAHHLEEMATYHLGQQFSSMQLQLIVDRLSVEAGTVLSDLMERLTEDQQIASAVQETGVALSALHQQLRDTSQQWTQSLYHWALKQGEETDFGRLSVRYRRELFSGKQKRIITSTEKIISQLSSYAAELETLLRFVEQTSQGTDELRSPMADLNGWLEQIRQTMTSLHQLLLEEADDVVFWLEVDPRTPRKQVFLFGAPLDVSAELAGRLFAEKRSLILTSATLTIKGRFDFMLAQYGLDQLPEREVRTLALGSPFDYQKQGLLLIPADFPALGKETDQSFLEAVIQGCVDIARASNGRTLVLFTSYAMLRSVHQGMKELLADEEFTILGHGIDSNNRGKLVRLFQSLPKAVLLGTSSFWEGVDIPGQALSSLVIVRLPFAPPNHPVLQGRSERLKAERKNPFMSLSLPQAVIQFKQGAGRLIRHHHDRGVLVVFDTRIVESRYGRAFIQSLPPFQMLTGPWTELRAQIEPFLAGMPTSTDS
ncbi:ATP-dependent DNA helicase DinG [Brevibacillus fulvus]|uniref:3'-5' exonuclease DinG n=1 Tax=Brevibacillus fulvus TaxID=1125967 RepID=A0A939BTS0_9BACL|nr:ATP-dependent DNA helicase DinG [Brevibacillus fulvus]MBM7588751.1 ATP-dependent DNA helicase DinG [Brevibacillus fulvus]